MKYNIKLNEANEILWTSQWTNISTAINNLQSILKWRVEAKNLNYTLIEILLKLSTAKYWSESHWDSGSRTLLQLSTDQYKSCADSTIERSTKV